MKTYSGHCHCGAVRFRFRSEELTSGLRCNCSICIRKGAVMSPKYYPPEVFEELVGLETMATYLFGDNMVHHFFCKTCGVYPFHDATTNPGHYRVNLGCIDGLDVLSLPVKVLDGKSF